METKLARIGSELAEIWSFFRGYPQIPTYTSHPVDQSQIVIKSRRRAGPRVENNFPEFVPRPHRLRGATVYAFEQSRERVGTAARGGVPYYTCQTVLNCDPGIGLET